MKKRIGVRKMKVTIPTGGNPLVVGKVPGDLGAGVIATSPAQSQDCGQPK